jgi:hypothetical protein
MKDKARKRAEEREFHGEGNSYLKLPDGTKFYSPKKGKQELDFLPFVVSVDHIPNIDPGELWYQYTYLRHTHIGADDKMYICPRTIKKPCPICEARAGLVKNKEAHKEIIEALRAKERELYQLIDLNNEADGIQIWDISYHLFGKKLEEELREGDTDWAGFAELENGYTLNVRFGEKKFEKTTFYETTRIDFTERDPYDKSILDKIIPLDKALIILEYAALEKIFLEVADELELSEGSDKPADVEEVSHPTDVSSFRKKRSVVEAPAEVVVVEAPKEVPIEAPKEAPATPKRRRVREEEASVPELPKCPAGGTFGEDCDKFEMCQDEEACKIWEDCVKAYDQIKKDRRAK